LAAAGKAEQKAVIELVGHHARHMFAVRRRQRGGADKPRAGRDEYIVLPIALFCVGGMRESDETGGENDAQRAVKRAFHAVENTGFRKIIETLRHDSFSPFIALWRPLKAYINKITQRFPRRCP
jgi:hypothetical protein